MLDNWQKLVLTEKNLLFFEKIEPSSALKILQNRMRNIHVHIPVIVIISLGNRNLKD